MKNTAFLFISALLCFPSASQAGGDAECNKTIAVIGDYGDGGNHEGQVARMIDSWNVDAIVTVGDNHYKGEKGASDSIDENVGKFYSAYISPYKGKYRRGSGPNRFFPALGNHDIDNWNDYKTFFPSPTNQHYYDTVVGSAHFFFVDTNSESEDTNSETVPNDQASWLKQRLAASPAAFKLVVFHQPPYASKVDHAPSTKLRLPFKSWGATTVLTGHNHIYERLEADGFTYFVNGAGGHGLESWKNEARESKAHFYGYGAQKIVTTCNKMVVEFIDTSGAVRDHVEFNVRAANAKGLTP